MERTLILVKPDAMRRRLGGAIISRLEEKGLKLIALKMLHMDESLGRRHYAVHVDKPFFPELLKFMTSSPIIAAVFEGEGAVELARKTMGATNPAKAEPGTIRRDFGVDLTQNSVHGSDSPETAAAEIELFFGDSEIFSY
ncbi:MAG: nucleoside-diphosphate kinase [Chloroflexi bacterium RBG_16_57_8]|nr:MAG: nucleoside-diphosphate kinase [Chloroflexi bacterium RBG_16_57_8]